MKISKLVTACLILGVAATPTFAANGKPFLELQAQIDSNKALIEENSGGIADLNVDIGAINARIDAVEANIAQVENDVADNTLAIGDALARISSTEADLQQLAADLVAVAAKHEGDLAAINLALEEIDAELVNLNNLRQALAADLNAKLAALKTSVDNNAVAIDGMLLDLVSVNAQLTGINSSITDLQNRQAQLETAQTQYASDLLMLEARVAELESNVTTLFSYHLYQFSGISTNLPIDELNGWSECYRETYATASTTTDVMAACTGNKIMLACSQTGSDTLSVAAYADRDEVFQDVGDGRNSVHTANGADWYLSDDWSMGFAPVGEGVDRFSADVKNQSSPDRLSWHTHSWIGGWRCGSNVWLNSSTAWEKIMYQAD